MPSRAAQTPSAHISAHISAHTHLRAQVARLLAPLALCAQLTSTAAAAPSAEDLKGLRDQARAAYSAGQFEQAQQALTTVVQAQPTSASDYLMLARSAYSNEDYARATVAYTLYFKLERRPEPEARDEHKEVKKRVVVRQYERRLKMSEERARDLERLAQSGQLHGPSGALNALGKIKREGIFHPRLKAAYESLYKALTAEHRALLSDWGRLDAQMSTSDAQRLMGAWAEWGQSLAGDAAESGARAALLRALLTLRAEPAEALSLLQALKEDDEDSRYALLLATGAAGRAEEARLFAGALAQRAKSEDLPRLSALLALYSARAGKPEEAARALADALYARPAAPPPAAPPPAAPAPAPAPSAGR